MKITKIKLNPHDKIINNITGAISKLRTENANLAKQDAALAARLEALLENQRQFTARLNALAERVTAIHTEHHNTQDALGKRLGKLVHRVAELEKKGVI